MHRFTPAVATVVGLIASLALVAPAQAATYGVSLTVNSTRADVGQTITLSGAVSGSGAAKKTVLVQRRIGSGAWTTIAKPRTSTSKKYALAYRVSVAGAHQFRVVAPTSGSTKAGYSPTRAFTGWAWLWLVQQPHIVFSQSYWGSTACAAGSCLPRSVSELYDSGSFVKFRLDGKCDDTDLRFAVPDGSSTQSAYSVGVQAVKPGGSIQTVTLTVGTWTTAPNTVTPDTTQLHIIKFHGTATQLLVGSPRIHCSVAELPSY